MGLKLGRSLNKLLQQLGFVPTPGADSAINTGSSETVESWDHTPSSVDAVCVDGDTKVPQLTDRFGSRPASKKASPPNILIGEFYALFKAYTGCKTVIICFDTRRRACIDTPRLEVGAERYGTDSDAPTAEMAEAEDPAADLESAQLVDPLEAEERSKLAFRSFLARGIARRIQKDIDDRAAGVKNKCACIEFAVLSPDNRIYGTPRLTEILKAALVYTEADTRIPACIVELQEARVLTHKSEVSIFTNDLDILTVACVVDGFCNRGLKALHLHRPPVKMTTEDKKTKKVPDMVIDLIKLKRAVERKLKETTPGLQEWSQCNYISWIFWLYLFHKTDYSKPPPGFGVIGSNYMPTYKFLDICSDCLWVNRRVLRSLLLEMDPEYHPLVLKHFTRTLWAMSFYMLLNFPSQRFGWTRTPGEFTSSDILGLDILTPLKPEDDGWMDISMS
jgi:hypothetical protein